MKQLPERLKKTYALRWPSATHWRAATCEEVRCPNWAKGWRTAVDESTSLGVNQAALIRRTRRGRFSEEKNALGLTVFTFSPGQPCFKRSEHRIQVERPPLYVVGDPGRAVPRRHATGKDFVEDFALHQAKLAKAADQAT